MSSGLKNEDFQVLDDIQHASEKVFEYEARSAFAVDLPSGPDDPRGNGEDPFPERGYVRQPNPFPSDLRFLELPGNLRGILPLRIYGIFRRVRIFRREREFAKQLRQLHREQVDLEFYRVGLVAPVAQVIRFEPVFRFFYGFLHGSPAIVHGEDFFGREGGIVRYYERIDRQEFLLFPVPHPVDAGDDPPLGAPRLRPVPELRELGNSPFPHPGNHFLQRGVRLELDEVLHALSLHESIGFRHAESAVSPHRDIPYPVFLAEPDEVFQESVREGRAVVIPGPQVSLEEIPVQPVEGEEGGIPVLPVVPVESRILDILARGIVRGVQVYDDFGRIGDPEIVRLQSPLDFLQGFHVGQIERAFEPGTGRARGYFSPVDFHENGIRLLVDVVVVARHPGYYPHDHLFYHLGFRVEKIPFPPIRKVFFKQGFQVHLPGELPKHEHSGISGHFSPGKIQAYLLVKLHFLDSIHRGIKLVLYAPSGCLRFSCILRILCHF